jgi:hypothetical protein
MKKELLISAKFDTSDFDKSVERMQNRLKDLYAPADMVRAQTQTNSRLASMGMGDVRPGVSQEQYQKTALQARRELDGYIKEEVKNQEKLTKMITSRMDKLTQLRQAEKEAVKNSKEELEIKGKIARVEENNFRLKEYYKQREGTLNQALDARNKVAPRDIPGLIDAFKGGGFRYGMSQIPGAFRQNPAGMGGALLSGIGGLLGAGSEMYRDFKGMPIRTESALGNASQSTLGRDVGNIYSRRTAFEQNFQPERQRAAQMAIENANANQLADKLGLAGNLAKIAGGGMMAYKGAGLGTAIGSAIPGLGNLAGGVAGALPGMAVAGKGIWNMMGDERQRSLMLSPFSQTSSNRYNSMIGEQMGRDYESTIESQKRQNPFKTAAVGEYEQNFMRNLQAQRSMGLDNQGFYGDGGFLRKNIGAGFTPEMGLEMAGQIQGSGGSTRMARESVFGNQMQRGMNMTNAGQVLGTLSGGIGGSEATKQATIGILAEGMKLGLDDSKFAEENRRFTQAAAEIISRSGAGAEGDFQRNARNFSSFMGENTNKGIEAAKSAYEQYQQISSSTTGPRGVMRAAGFMKDKYLSQLSTIEKQALMQLPEEQLNANNPLVSGLAEKAGTSPEDFVNRIRGVNQGAVSRFKEADQIRDRLRAKGIDVGRSGDPEYLKSLSKEDRQDVTQLMAYQTTELGNQGQKEMISRAAGTVGKPEMYGPSANADVVGARLSGTSGRMEDNTVAAMAGDASTVLKNFNEMSGGMDAAAKSAAAFTDQIRELNAQLQQALEDSRNGKGSKGINDIMQKIMTSPNNANQSQAGKQAK